MLSFNKLILSCAIIIFSSLNGFVTVNASDKIDDGNFFPQSTFTQLNNHPTFSKWKRHSLRSINFLKSEDQVGDNESLDSKFPRDISDDQSDLMLEVQIINNSEAKVQETAIIYSNNIASTQKYFTENPELFPINKYLDVNTSSEVPVKRALPTARYADHFEYSDDESLDSPREIESNLLKKSFQAVQSYLERRRTIKLRKRVIKNNLFKTRNISTDDVFLQFK